MKLVLKIVFVFFIGAIILGFMMNSIPYPTNIAGAILIVAFGYCKIETEIKRSIKKSEDDSNKL